MSKNFFSLEIRDVNFDFDKYYLSLENIDENILHKEKELNDKIIKVENLPKDSISEITSYTLIPKFSIDKFGSPILYRVFNIDYEIINQKEENNKIDDKEEKNNINNIIEVENKIKEFKINVKSFRTKEIVCSFSVRFPLFPEYYDALGKFPDKIKIVRFPCILLQSESGYYSLKKIIGTKKKREEEISFAVKFEPEKNVEAPSNIEKKPKKKKSYNTEQKPMKKKIKNRIDFQKIMQSKGFYDSTLSILKEKKQELLNKKKEINVLIEERKNVLKEKEKILSCHKNLEIAKNSWNRLVTLKEILTKINTFTKEVLEIKENRISLCKEEIKIYKDEVNKKKKKEIPKLKKVNIGLQITNYLLYKYAINEFCYYFFNKNLNEYKAFPSFYKVNLNDLNLSKKMVEEFYNKNTKHISSFFGNIVFILYYLSKKFDIIFPYGLYYNGSKSMIFLNIGGKSRAIDMYMKENEENVLAYGAKNENDIQIKTEILSKMIYDVLMFFYSKKICSDEFSIANISNGKNNFYLNFIKLNELFKDILNKNENK